MKPFFETQNGKLYCGDCREFDIVFDEDAEYAILTDPPYSSGGFQEAGKSAGSIGTRQKTTIALDNLSTRGYQRLMRSMLRKFNLADEVYIFTDWRMWIYTFDSIEDGGWRVRNMLIWDKKHMGMGLPWRNQHEIIAYGKRTPAKKLENSGKCGNVLKFNRSGNKNHPTEKPVNLLRHIIGNTSSNTIIDPFIGSGTTAVACELMRRKWIGFELNQEFCEIAVRRIKEETKQVEMAWMANKRLHGDPNRASQFPT